MSVGQSPGRAAKTTLVAGDVALLLLMEAGLSLLRAARTHLPTHDTMQVFHVFHHEYSSLRLHDSFAFWNPYGVFGMPMDFWMAVALTPSDYLAMLLGRTFGVDDVLALFKFSIAMQESVALVSLYALGRLLFQSRWSTWFVLVGAAFTYNSYAQIWWNLRLYYLVPAVLALLLAFFRSGNPFYFWASGVAVVVSLLGSLHYFVPIYAYTLAVFALPLAAKNVQALRGLLRPSYANLVGATLFVLFAAAYMAGTMYSFDSIVMDTPGRSADGLSSSLSNFLTHGGVPNPMALLQQAVVGWPIFADWHDHADITLYMGLLPFLLVPFGLVHCRSREALAVALAGLFVLALSLGGVFASLAYALPGMNLFRHLSLLHPLTKVFWLLLFGFGVDAFLRRGRSVHLLLMAAGAVVLADLLVPDVVRSVVLGRGISTAEPAQLVFTARTAVYAAAGLLSWLAVAALRRSLGARRIRGMPLVPLVLFASYVVDVASYRLASDRAIRRVPDELAGNLDALDVAPFPYSAQRRSDIESGRTRAASELTDFARSSPGNPYTGVNQMALAFLRHDPCESYYFSPWRTRVVRRFFAAQRIDPVYRVLLTGGTYTHELFQMRPRVESMIPAWHTANQALLRTLGCVAPKLRVTREAKALPAAAEADVDDAAVKVVKFTPDLLQVRVSVPERSPAWLVYADAWDEHWSATVNGEARKVLPAYGAFKAVEVPSGTSLVRFTYRQSRVSPVLVLAGLATLIQAMCAVVGVVLLIMRLRRNGPEP